MKKTIIGGIASLAIAATPVLSVFAEAPTVGDSTTGYFTGTKNVTVGDVDETVYSVDIDWGDNMVFDWKYNYNQNSFNFTPRMGCEGYVMHEGDVFLNQARVDGKLYSDDSCSTLQTDVLVNGDTYYAKSAIGGHIMVTDSSVNGRLKVNAGFVASEDYDWLTGKFASSYDYNWSTGEIEYSDDLFEGNLVSQLGSANSAIYHTWLHFEKNTDSAIPTEAIHENDRIGLIIINIEPDLN